MPADPPPVHVIGMGDDGPAGLGAEARALLAHADLVCGGHRHLGLLSGGAKAGARLMPITADLDGLVAAIENARQEGGCAVVLASGDPLFFGIGEALGRRLGREALHVLPAPSSVQLAFARIGLSWQDAVVLSAHGRPLGRILGRAMAATKMAVLTDGANTPAAVARALLNGGMEDARAAVGEHLGGPRERVTRGVLSEIAGREFARLNVLIVEREPAMVRWGRPLVGQPESAYAHARGMITKAEVRAVSLSRLGMDRATVAWDIGAGSGSVAIEAASLNLDAEVYAIERDPEQLALLRANVRRYTAGNVRVVEGCAPEALGPLPDPDAVFVGGTGGRLEETLSVAVARLRSGGRLVANVITIEHLARAQAQLRDAGLTVAMTQVWAARGAAAGDGARLAALNPVFIVSGERPA